MGDGGALLWHLLCLGLVLWVHCPSEIFCGPGPALLLDVNMHVVYPLLLPVYGMLVYKIWLECGCVAAIVHSGWTILLALLGHKTSWCASGGRTCLVYDGGSGIK